MSDIIITPWGVRAFGRRLPCAIGRGGLVTDKREGDGGTPIGIHRVMGLLYRPDRLAPPAPWADPIRPGDLWSDDTADPRYNHLVKAPSSHSHERMRRADPLYDAVIVTDWNWPNAIPGQGSAIFLHIWRKPRHPTEGCVAFSKRDFLWLLPRLAPGTALRIS